MDGSKLTAIDHSSSFIGVGVGIGIGIDKKGMRRFDPDSDPEGRISE